MSLLLKVIRCNAIKITRCRPLLYNNTKPVQPPASFCMPPACQSRFSSSNSGQQTNQTQKDDIKYIVSFKNQDIRLIFKKFYSLYGPLFVACHIGVSLMSLGFFSALVWLVVDPVQYIPEYLLVSIGEKTRDMTAQGGKFFIAYGIHKVMLPFRLVGSIYLTRLLAPKIQLLRKKWYNLKQDDQISALLNFISGTNGTIHLTQAQPT